MKREKLGVASEPKLGSLVSLHYSLPNGRDYTTNYFLRGITETNMHYYTHG